MHYKIVGLIHAGNCAHLRGRRWEVSGRGCRGLCKSLDSALDRLVGSVSTFSFLALCKLHMREPVCDQTTAGICSGEVQSSQYPSSCNSKLNLNLR